MRRAASDSPRMPRQARRSRTPPLEERERKGGWGLRAKPFLKVRTGRALATTTGAGNSACTRGGTRSGPCHPPHPPAAIGSGSHPPCLPTVTVPARLLSHPRGAMLTHKQSSLSAPSEALPSHLCGYPCPSTALTPVSNYPWFRSATPTRMLPPRGRGPVRMIRAGPQHERRAHPRTAQEHLLRKCALMHMVMQTKS